MNPTPWSLTIWELLIGILPLSQCRREPIGGAPGLPRNVNQADGATEDAYTRPGASAAERPEVR